MGDMSALVYQKAFVLTAGLDFDYADEDQRKHVTNLSVNKRFANHPGQIPVDLVQTYPEIYRKIANIWRAVTEAAAPFMCRQSSARHFEFFGMDVIADEQGDCWLIEANRLPGLESSDNNRAEEDVFYDDMMRDVLRIVLREAPLEEGSAVSSGLISSGDNTTEGLNERHKGILGRWEYVAGPSSLSNVTSVPKTKKEKLIIAPRLPYHVYKSSDDIEIWVGRTAEDNDELSCNSKLRHNNEWWLHAAGCAGSHVVIKCTDDDLPTKYRQTVLDAAYLAAVNSKAHTTGGGNRSGVNLTRCRNISKPRGAVAGLVHLSGECSTVSITPKKETERKERLKRV
eukprot:gene21945-28025_t